MVAKAFHTQSRDPPRLRLRVPIVEPDDRPVAQVIRALRIVPGAPIMAVRKKRRQHAKPHAVLHEALMIRDVLRDDVDLLAVWVLCLVGIPAGSDGWVCEAACSKDGHPVEGGLYGKGCGGGVDVDAMLFAAKHERREPSARIGCMQTESAPIALSLHPCKVPKAIVIHQ